MKILLINSNPVVSRLTTLSARKESVKLDEIKDISELKKSDYNIVFVDFESYNEEVSHILSNSNIPKRVLFYTQDDKDTPEIFNISILKPFLPSEVSAILRESKIKIEEESAKEEYVELNDLIADKKDDLTPITLGENITKTEEKKVEKKTTKEEIKKHKKIEEKIELEPINLIKDEVSDKKTEDKKQNEEEKLLAELKNSKEKIKKIEQSPDLDIITEVSAEDAKDDIKLFEVDFKEEKEDIADKNELFDLDNTASPKDELLNFDIESKDEIDFESDLFDEIPKEKEIKEESLKKDTIKEKDLKNESKKEKSIEEESPKEESLIKEIPKEQSTKILNQDEISNIKNLLDDKETKEEMTLEDVMTTTSPKPLAIIEPKPPKKRNKKSKKSNTGSKVLMKSLKSLPIDDLRRLLLGAEVHITIKFPKE